MFALQVSVEPFGKSLILGRIADETGLELDGISHERLHVRDEIIGNTGTTQERFRDIRFGAIDGVNTDGRRPKVSDGFKALYSTQVNVRHLMCTPLRN